MYHIYDVATAQMINEVINLHDVNEYTNFDDIENAFLKYYYYVSPYNYPEGFYEHFYEFASLYKSATEKAKPIDSIADQILTATIRLNIIRKYFDEEYFRNRLEFHVKYCDEECLREYLSKLSTEHLREFLPLLMRSVFVFGSNSDNLEKLWYKLNAKCREKEPALEEIMYSTNAYGYMNVENPTYFLDYLGTEIVVDLFCENILQENRRNAAALARIMYLDGYEEADYMESVWCCECNSPD